jgi:hypothetical protein
VAHDDYDRCDGLRSKGVQDVLQDGLAGERRNQLGCFAKSCAKPGCQDDRRRGGVIAHTGFARK